MKTVHSTRRDFLKGFGLGAASLMAPKLVLAGEPDRSRPNILFCLADDWSCSKMHSYPHLRARRHEGRSLPASGTGAWKRAATSGARCRRNSTSTRICWRRRAITWVTPARDGHRDVTALGGGRATPRDRATRILENFERLNPRASPFASGSAARTRIVGINGSPASGAA